MDTPAEGINRETQSYPDNHIWRKSSKSMSDGHCVEVGLAGQYVLLRDSKNPIGPGLAVNALAWNSLIQEIKQLA